MSCVLIPDLRAPLELMSVDAGAVASVVVFVYHYFSSFPHERQYIWNAPPSFAKHGYLLSRHLIIPCVLVTFVAISGFEGLDFNNSVRDACMRAAADPLNAA
jgi:hypothetical protein